MSLSSRAVMKNQKSDMHGAGQGMRSSGQGTWMRGKKLLFNCIDIGYGLRIIHQLISIEVQ